MKYNKYKNLVYFLLTCLWALIIYYFSSIPDLKSGLDSVVDLILRKGAHIFAYTVLAYLLAKTFNKNTKIYLFLVFVICVLYAATDEIHQLSVAHRSGNIFDVLVDSFGVFWGLVFYRFFRK